MNDANTQYDFNKILKETNPRDVVVKCLKDNQKALYIGRVGRKHKKMFIDWANRDYEGDYGLLLTHLIDTYGQFDAKYDEILSIIEEILKEIDMIKKALFGEKEKKPIYKTMLDGRKILIGYEGGDENDKQGSI